MKEFGRRSPGRGSTEWSVLERAGREGRKKKGISGIMGNGKLSLFD